MRLFKKLAGEGFVDFGLLAQCLHMLVYLCTVMFLGVCALLRIVGLEFVVNGLGRIGLSERLRAMLRIVPSFPLRAAAAFAPVRHLQRFAVKSRDSQSCRLPNLFGPS